MVRVRPYLAPVLGQLMCFIGASQVKKRQREEALRTAEQKLTVIQKDEQAAETAIERWTAKRARLVIKQQQVSTILGCLWLEYQDVRKLLRPAGTPTPMSSAASLQAEVDVAHERRALEEYTQHEKVDHSLSLCADISMLAAANSAAKYAELVCQAGRASEYLWLALKFNTSDQLPCVTGAAVSVLARQDRIVVHAHSNVTFSQRCNPEFCGCTHAAC